MADVGAEYAAPLSGRPLVLRPPLRSEFLLFRALSLSRFLF